MVCEQVMQSKGKSVAHKPDGDDECEWLMDCLIEPGWRLANRANRSILSSQVIAGVAVFLQCLIHLQTQVHPVLPSN